MRFAVSKSALIILLVFLAVLILHYSGIILPVENIAVKALTPIGAGFYNFSQKIQVIWKPKLSSENYEELQSEINRLVAKNVELKMLEEENQKLRDLLNFPKDDQYNLLVAKIIGRDPSLSNHFILDKGTRDGVQNNFSIISPEGMLVGKILKAEENTSVIIIPTDANFQTAAVILGKTQKSTSGLVHGEKGLGIRMEFIPQDESIEIDDIVATSGLERSMPRGLVVGKIAEVKKEARNIFGEAIISPFIDYEKLSIVAVLLPKF